MKTFFTSILTAAFFMPLFAHAEILSVSAETEGAITISQGTTSSAYIFTACSQASIEARDSSIASARTTYNAAMANALNVRKDAEKSAVTLGDTNAKKDAITAAVDAYKKAVTTAQETLTDARTKAWAGFEKDMEGCRQYNKEAKPMMATMSAEKKAAVTTMVEKKKEVVAEKKADMQALHVEQKAAVNAAIETKQTEIKTIRETFKAQLNAFLSFFTKKPQVAAEASIEVESK